MLIFLVPQNVLMIAIDRIWHILLLDDIATLIGEVDIKTESCGSAGSLHGSIKMHVSFV